MTIKKVKNFSKNKKIIQDLFTLTKPSYIDNTSVLNREINLCNEIYLMYDPLNNLMAFFMISYQTFTSKHFCYLGLSACRHDHKNNGYIKKLYLEFARDCIKKEIKHNIKIITYWTTATPIVYHWFSKYFRNVQPDRSGNCTEEGLANLLNIALEKYPKENFNHKTPFVLRKIAEQTYYSEQEKNRLKQTIIDLNLSVFQRYNLDESNGDRFLMLGYTPPHNQLIELMQGL